MTLVVKNLSKIYGEQKAVNNISFNANEGEILGFLGPNGAGKSTTMKVSTCFIPPTLGTVELCGYDVQKSPIEVRKNVGYLPEHNPLYLDMYVHEYLQFIGSLHSLNGKKLRNRVGEMIDLVGLVREQNKKIGALSKGYRQRVGLAQALIHDPKVLILDEPTTGLDPNQIQEIRQVIRKVSSANKTVIFSTHIMQEVQALCDRVVIINLGEIVANDSVENLKGKLSRNAVVVQFANQSSVDKIQLIEDVSEVENIGQNTFKVFVDKSTDIREKIFHFAVNEDNPIIGMQLEEISLENVFKSLTKKEGELKSH